MKCNVNAESIDSTIKSFINKAETPVIGLKNYYDSLENKETNSNINALFFAKEGDFVTSINDRIAKLSDSFKDLGINFNLSVNRDIENDFAIEILKDSNTINIESSFDKLDDNNTFFELNLLEALIHKNNDTKVKEYLDFVNLYGESQFNKDIHDNDEYDTDSLRIYESLRLPVDKVIKNDDTLRGRFTFIKNQLYRTLGETIRPVVTNNKLDDTDLGKLLFEKVLEIQDDIQAKNTKFAEKHYTVNEAQETSFNNALNKILLFINGKIKSSLSPDEISTKRVYEKLYEEVTNVNYQDMLRTEFEKLTDAQTIKAVRTFYFHIDNQVSKISNKLDTFNKNQSIEDKLNDNRFQTFIKESMLTLNMFTNIKDLSTVKEDSEKKEIIRLYKELSPKVDTLKSEIEKHIKEYILYKVSQTTSNPKYKENPRLLEEAFPDETFLQLNLDAAFDSPHPFVANGVKMRERKEAKNKALYQEITNKFLRTREEFIKNGGVEDNLRDNINGTKINKFIPEYNTDDLERQETKLRTELIIIGKQKGRDSKEYYDKNKEILEFKHNNFISPYTDEFQEIMQLPDWANAMVSDLYYQRDLVLTQAKRITDEGKKFYDFSKLSNDAFEEYQQIVKDIKQLSSTLNPDGSKKEGQELDLANAIKKRNEAMKDVFVDLYVLQEEFETSWKQAIENGEEDNFIRTNTIEKIDSKFYEEFLKRIETLSKNAYIGTTTQKQDFKDFVKPFRDTNYIINGNELSPEQIDWIREYDKSKYNYDVQQVKLLKPFKAFDDVVFTDAFYSIIKGNPVIKTVNDTWNSHINDQLKQVQNDDGTFDMIMAIKKGILDKVEAFNRARELQLNVFDKDTFSLRTDGILSDLLENRGRKEFLDQFLDFDINQEAYDKAEKDALKAGILKKFKELNTEEGFSDDFQKEIGDIFQALSAFSKNGNTDGFLLRQFLKLFNDDNHTVNGIKVNENEEAVKKIKSLMAARTATNRFFLDEALTIPAVTLYDLKNNKLYTTNGEQDSFTDNDIITFSNTQYDKFAEKAENDENIEYWINELYKIAYDKPTDYFNLVFNTNGIKPKIKSEQEEFDKNHYINDMGMTVPLPQWTKLSPRDTTQLVTKPKQIYWGTISGKSEFVDWQRTEDKQWIEENVNKLPTEYYNQRFAYERDNDFGSGSFQKWYDANHILNPYTNQMEPLSIWTTLRPKTDKYKTTILPNDKWTVKDVSYKYKNKNYKTDRQDKNGNEVGKALPKDNHKNPNYTALTKQEKDYRNEIKTLLNELTNHTYSRHIIEGLFPTFILPEKVKNVKLLDYLSNDTYNEISTDESGLPVMKLKLQHSQLAFQDKSLYQEWPKGDDVTVEQIMEVYDNNKKGYKQNLINHSEGTNSNLGMIIPLFIKDSLKHKSDTSIETDLNLLMKQLQQMKVVKTNGIGIELIDRFQSKFSDKEVKATENEKESNAYKHFKNWMEHTFYGMELDEGIKGKIADLLINYTSINGMWMNMFSGINNVTYGKSQIFIEAIGGEDFKNINLNEARKLYFSGLSDYSGKNEFSNTTLIGAIIRRLDVYKSQDELEGKLNATANTIMQKALMIRNKGFFMQHAGEHFMQNQALLAMMDSHRIIDGKILSFNDFLEKKGLIKITGNITKRAEEKEAIKANKELTKIAKEEFESYTKLIDAYEFVGGAAKIKENIKLDEDAEADFENKVVGVNHKLHGIYNKSDRSIFQQQFYGRAVMQFRKYYIPGLNKRFGRTFGKSTYSERLGREEEGMYVSTFNFLTKPVKDAWNLQKDSENKEYIKFFLDTLASYKDFFGNANIYWHTLTQGQKANVMKTATEYLTFLAIYATWLLIKALKAKYDDDEDDVNSWALGMLIYQIDKLSTEMQTYYVIGGIDNAKKIAQSPIPAWKNVSNGLKAVGELASYPFKPSDEWNFKGGAHHGDNKLIHYVLSDIPGISQAERMYNIQNNNRYYKLYSQDSLIEDGLNNMLDNE